MRLPLVSSALVASRWPGFQWCSDCSTARATVFAAWSGESIGATAPRPSNSARSKRRSCSMFVAVVNPANSAPRLSKKARETSSPSRLDLAIASPICAAVTLPSPNRPASFSSSAAGNTDCRSPSFSAAKATARCASSSPWAAISPPWSACAALVTAASTTPRCPRSAARSTWRANSGLTRWRSRWHPAG